MFNNIKAQAEKLYTETRLYHGTALSHAEIDLRKSRDNKDFGRGYYLTSIPFQAEEWAKRNGDVGWVYEYAVSVPPDCAVLSRPDYDEEWLNLITYCRVTRQTPTDRRYLRGGCEPTEYGIIAGGVADNQPGMELNRLLRRYRDQLVEAAEVLRQIQPGKIMDQYCFRTENAVRLLRRERAWKWTRENGRWIRRDENS